MAQTPKHVNVTVSADEIAKLQRAYEERIDRQTKRIGTFLDYLSEKNLVDDFNEWETKKNA